MFARISRYISTNSCNSYDLRNLTQKIISISQRRGPQRSVDVIVSGAFILTLLLLAFLSVEWLKDSVQLQSQHTLEALIWSCALGCFLLRFMTVGTKINRKYRSISVLITEQINLYLQVSFLFNFLLVTQNKPFTFFRLNRNPTTKTN